MPLPQEFHDLARTVNNWGRWGEDDQRGTLNLVTAEVVRRGVAAAVAGDVVPLAIPLSPDGPQAGLVPGRDNPTHRMTQVNEPMLGDTSLVSTSDGAIDLSLQAATHWDALCHVSYDGRLYNGQDPAVVTADGATALSIDRLGPVVSRGVLLDVPRALGRDALEPGHALTPDDLDAAAEFGRVTVTAGDIVLVRTGQIRAFHAGDRIAYAFPSAGPSMQTVPWFHRHDVAAVATDNLTFEVFPGERDDAVLPVHLLHLVEMGLTQGQNFDLEVLAERCAEDRRHDFLLSATPEPVVGGAGAPVAPVAIR